MANSERGAKTIQKKTPQTDGKRAAVYDPPLDYLKRPGGMALAFRRSEGKAPCVVFLGGLRSTMESPKALIAENAAREHGLGFLRFDYSGHGASEGRFEDGTIGQWKRDTLDCLDQLTDGPLIIIGSSLGGWLALLAALERPKRVQAMLILSCAADFTEHFYHRLLGPAQQEEMQENGYIAFPSCKGGDPFIITQKLVDEGCEHLIMPRKALAIDVPVHFLAGMLDQDVPWQTSKEVAARLPAGRASVEMIETARHQFDRPEDIEHFRDAVEACLERSA